MSMIRTQRYDSACRKTVYGKTSPSTDPEELDPTVSTRFDDNVEVCEMLSPQDIEECERKALRYPTLLKQLDERFQKVKQECGERSDPPRLEEESLLSEEPSDLGSENDDTFSSRIGDGAVVVDTKTAPLSAIVRVRSKKTAHIEALPPRRARGRRSRSLSPSRSKGATKKQPLFPVVTASRKGLSRPNPPPRRKNTSSEECRAIRPGIARTVSCHSLLGTAKRPLSKGSSHSPLGTEQSTLPSKCLERDDFIKNLAEEASLQFRTILDDTKDSLYMGQRRAASFEYMSPQISKALVARKTQEIFARNKIESEPTFTEFMVKSLDRFQVILDETNDSAFFRPVNP